MKYLLLAAILIATPFGVGAIEDYQNEPGHDCTKVSSAPDYWLYTCQQGESYYEAK